MKAVTLVVLVGLAGCSGTAMREASGPIQTPRELGPVTVLETRAAPGSVGPNLSSGADGRVYMSWIEPTEIGHALRFSVWGEDGWSSALTIASGTEWFVNWADFPSMAALADGTLAAHWLQREGAGTYAYGVRLVVSGDGGGSWYGPIIPHRDRTETEHGFVSLVPLGKQFVLAWLDGREMEAHGGEGAMTVRSATLRREATVDPDVLIDGRACDCCPTDAAPMEDGSIVLVYRDRSPGEIRDISLCRFEGGGWSEPTPVHADGWKIAGCPVNGPAVGVHGSDVACAWYTEDGEQALVRLAFSRDGGRTFSAPFRIDAGNPLGRVDLVATGSGAAIVTWVEERGESAEILAREVNASGEMGPIRLIAPTSAARSAGFPRMIRRGQELFFAWTEPGEPSRVRSARLELGGT